jgi:hypothetical protein
VGQNENGLCKFRKALVRCIVSYGVIDEVPSERSGTFRNLGTVRLVDQTFNVATGCEVEKCTSASKPTRAGDVRIVRGH